MAEKGTKDKGHDPLATWKKDLDLDVWYVQWVVGNLYNASTQVPDSQQDRIEETSSGSGRIEH